MVSEEAAKILGLEVGTGDGDDISRAFWLANERLDQRIIDTEDAGELGRLLEEKDRLLEARALLEGISLAEVRKELLEKSPRPGNPSRVLLAAAIAGWVLAVLGAAVVFWVTRAGGAWPVKDG